MKRSRIVLLLFVGVGVLFIASLFALIRLSSPTPAVTVTHDLDTLVAKAVESTLLVVRKTQTLTNTPDPTGTPSPSLLPTENATNTLRPSPRNTATPSDTAKPTFTPSPAIPSLYEAVCVPPNTHRDIGQVIGIIDGDTITVRIANSDFEVRYLGIEAPDIGARYGDAAVAQNAKLVMWQPVTLVQGASEADPEGWLLRYVFVGNTFVNYDLVRKGHALAADHSPHTACQDTFERAEAEAKKYRLGYWAPGPTNTPWPTDPHLTPSKTLKPTRTPTCDSAYPTVCIPPRPPDLDCEDIMYSNFQVLEPDPHGFDEDGDGIGCDD